MKTKLIIVLFIICLILTGCKKNNEASIPQNVDNTANPTNSNSMDVPVPGNDSSQNVVPIDTGDPLRIKDAVYSETDRVFHSAFMNMSLVIPEKWNVLDRNAIASNFGYNDEYAKADPYEILSYHYPYYELCAKESNNSIFIMIENPPIPMSDGLEVSSAANYMDHNNNYLPEYYKSMGLNVSKTERSSVELAGRNWEKFSFAASNNASTITQTMISADKDGYIYTIYITCVGKDITDDIISGITSD